MSFQEWLNVREGLMDYLWPKKKPEKYSKHRTEKNRLKFAQLRQQSAEEEEERIAFLKGRPWAKRN